MNKTECLNILVVNRRKFTLLALLTSIISNFVMSDDSVNPTVENTWAAPALTERVHNPVHYVCQRCSNTFYAITLQLMMFSRNLRAGTWGEGWTPGSAHDFF